MKALTIGTFDLLHYGHLAFLERCRAMSTELVVGVNTDDFVITYKKRAPAMTQAERFAAIIGLGMKAVCNTGDHVGLIDRIGPQLLIVGSDWATGNDYYKQIGMTQTLLDKRGIVLCYVPYTRGVSSGQIRRRIERRYLEVQAHE